VTTLTAEARAKLRANATIRDSIATWQVGNDGERNVGGFYLVTQSMWEPRHMTLW